MIIRRTVTMVGLLLFGLLFGSVSAKAGPQLSHVDALRLRALQEDERVILPSTTQIDRAENALSQQPCIGDLRRWQRRYAWKIDYEHGHVDRNRISFDLRKASKGYKAGRYVGRLKDLFGVDEANSGLASGTYDLASNAVHMDACVPSASDR